MEAKILIVLSTPTPIRICSGDPMYWGFTALTYATKSIKVPKVTLSDAGSTGWYIEINDDDWSMRDALDADVAGWANFTVSFRKITREPNEDWATSDIVVMTKTEIEQSMDDRWMKISLGQLTGLNSRSCLTRGSRTLFPDCPGPQDVIEHGGKEIRFPGGNRGRSELPGGATPRYNLPVRTTQTLVAPDFFDVPGIDRNERQPQGGEDASI